MSAHLSMQKYAKILNVWTVFKNSDTSRVAHVADAASVGKVTGHRNATENRLQPL